MMTRGGFLGRLLAAPLAAMGLQRFGGTAAVEEVGVVTSGLAQTASITTTASTVTYTVGAANTIWYDASGVVVYGNVVS